MKHGNFTSLVIIIQHSLIRSTNLIFENEIFLILLIQNLLLIHKILSSFFFLDSKLRKGINLGRNVTRYVTRLRYKHWQSASLEMITRMSLSLSLLFRCGDRKIHYPGERSRSKYVEDAQSRERVTLIERTFFPRNYS